MKTRTGINGVRSLHFGLQDLEGAARYYEDLWGLRVVSRTAETVYLRGTGPDFYVLALHRQPESRMLCVDFSIDSPTQADALRASLALAGVEVGAAGPLEEPGGGYGFTFRDPDEGRVFRVVAEAAEHADREPQADRPSKISHVVLRSPNRDSDFFVEHLGFRVIDRTRTITFLNCGKDHHNLALYTSKGSSFHHVAFEMRDLNSVMSASGNMVEHGEQIGWGVGRHGPCDNVFCYFVGPGGFVVEYTAEVEQVDESYRVGEPEDWSFRPGRRDQWGLSLPSKHMTDQEAKVQFSDVLFRP